MLYFSHFPIEAKASKWSIRQKLQISSAGVLRSTDAGQAPKLCLSCRLSCKPTIPESISDRKRVKPQQDPGQQHTRTEGTVSAAHSQCPHFHTLLYVVRDSYSSLSFLCHATVCHATSIRKFVSTYSSPDGSLRIFPIMMGLHNMLSKF